MNQADYQGFTEMAFQQPRSGDAKLYVEFKLKPLKNEAESIKAGRPIFEDKEFVSIHMPGSRDVILREAQDEDKARFPRQYENFLRGKPDAIVGTPLEALPTVSAAQREELAFFKIRTVEALAELNDTVASKFQGAQNMKRQAKAFLEAAAGAAPALRLEAELKQRDEEIALLKQQLSELAADVRKGKK